MARSLMQFTRLILFGIVLKLPIVSSLSLSSLKSPPKSKNIIFPGGGIFFYWQAGAITFLKEKGYPLEQENVNLTGASAGALCATLTAAMRDNTFEDATELALSKARDAGVWDRPLGLYGIWGGMIDTWLDELLPEEDETLSLVDDRLTLLVTKIPSFENVRVSEFKSKRDLINANMASVHIPLFLNGKLTSNFRNSPHIDGSFRTTLSNYDYTRRQSVVLDWSADPKLSDRTLSDAVTALSEDGIWDLLESGRKYAEFMEKRGDFDFLLR